MVGEWVLGDRLIERELPGVDAPRKIRDGCDRLRLVRRERPVRVVAVARHDDPRCAGHDGRRGSCPVERVGVAIEGHSAVLEEVADKQDVGAGHGGQDVVIGVTTAEEREVDRSIADGDGDARGERPVRRVQHDISQVRRDLRGLERDPGPSDLTGPGHERDASVVAPDRCRPEDVVAEGMVEMSVRVDDRRDREGRELAQVREDLATLDVGGPGVDDERLPVAEDDSDVLVEERVPADEHAVADLDPAIRDAHDRMVSRWAVAYAAVMPSVTGRVPAADGTELLTRHWSSAGTASDGVWVGPPWGSVLLLHGLGEHSGRYEHVGDQLADAGLDVHAYDQRGNGGSGGRRGHVERWTQLLDDLAERLAAVRGGAGEGPLVLYAHSMGALVAAGYLLDGRPQPDLAVLSSPGLDSTLPGWKKGLARLLGGVAPTLALRNGLDGATLSRDPSVAEKVRADPAAAKVTTARFGAEALAEQARIRREAPGGFRIPVLVLHGLDDGLVPASASELLVSVPGVERRTYPGLRHELHNEPEGPEIVAEILAWIRERGTLGPQPNTASGERLER